uniref:Uncharacterized protein n=1 Tax=Anguilla anguilla TaxID=7936 RepID=A0A0E9X3T4_ANGAN
MAGQLNEPSAWDVVLCTLTQTTGFILFIVLVSFHSYDVSNSFISFHVEMLVVKTEKKNVRNDDALKLMNWYSTACSSLLPCGFQYWCNVLSHSPPFPW